MFNVNVEWKLKLFLRKLLWTQTNPTKWGCRIFVRRVGVCPINVLKTEQIKLTWKIPTSHARVKIKHSFCYKIVTVWDVQPFNTPQNVCRWRSWESGTNQDRRPSLVACRGKERGVLLKNILLKIDLPKIILHWSIKSFISDFCLWLFLRDPRRLPASRCLSATCTVYPRHTLFTRDPRCLPALHR